MRRLFLLVALSFVWPRAQAQDPLEDYVLEVRGDTLVIADYFDAGGVTGTLGAVIVADTHSGDVPDGRVYLLHAGTNGPLELGGPALYLFDFEVPAQGRPLTIVGEFCGLMVQGEDPECRPPTMSGFVDVSTIPTFPALNIDHDLTLKNLHFTSATILGQAGWSFVNVDGDDVTVRWENVLAEHNRWTWINSNDNVGTALYITDSYLLNATDFESRRTGGVYDNIQTPTDIVWVENSTHVENAGMQYNFRSYSPSQVVFNHNTFVNAAGQLFASFGYLTTFAATNNLFVNSNYQPYYPGLDADEFYPESEGLPASAFEPHGIVNLAPLRQNEAGEPIAVTVAAYPGVEVFPEADRRVLIDLNAAHWDASLLTIADALNAAEVEGDVCSEDGCVTGDPSLDWTSQAILANDRTVGMFDDDTTYPLLTWGTWYEAGAPGFVDGPGMVGDLYDWGYDSAFSNVSRNDLLPKVREPGNEIPSEDGTGTNWIVFDWPVAVDLSYSNATYLDGGYNGYPLGDLNWFAGEKPNWLAQRDAEHAAIAAALDAATPLVPTEGGTSVVAGPEAVEALELTAVAPNPVTGTARVSFALPTGGRARVSVVDVRGREVAVLVDGSVGAGRHEAVLEAAGLASGVYLVRLEADGRVVTRQVAVVR